MENVIRIETCFCCGSHQGCVGKAIILGCPFIAARRGRKKRSKKK